jgi:hypothetical protein
MRLIENKQIYVEVELSCSAVLWFTAFSSFYLHAEGLFGNSAGVAMSSATPVVLSTTAACRHVSAYSGTNTASLSPRLRSRARRLRSGPGTHSTACRRPLRATRSRRGRSWRSSSDSLQGASASGATTTRASRHRPVVQTHTLPIP